MEDGSKVTRRTALRLAGGSVAAGGLVGVVGADDGLIDGDGDRVRVNVGYRTAAGRSIAEDAAGTVIHDHPTGILTLEVDRNALSPLRRSPGIRFVERDVELETVQTVPYGIERVNAPDAHAAGETGDGADVAVIDTGIQGDHPDLQANVGEGRAFLLGLSHGNWEDSNGHGTHCAGTIGAVDDDQGVVGVAPEVTLHAVKVMNSIGTGFTSDIAAGIEWAADQGHDVANLSLGGSGSNTLREACQYAADRGMLLVAAAGNDGPCTDCVSAPAAYPECFAVAATDENDDAASFSSTGAEIEIAAPGANVESTYTGGGYQTLSGTSMAAPHVAGGAAQLVANGYSADEARQRLKDTAEDVGLPETDQGEGRMDVAAALGV